jgi:hypothetical protein
MRFDLQQGVEILSRTPAVLRAMLAGLGEHWVRSNYGPDTFSPFDVVGHLIHGEQTDWLPRLRRILTDGPRVKFDAFDRYAMYDASRGRSIGDLLDEFAALRAANLKALAALPVIESLDLTGTHPTLGPVTVRNLLACWVAHDLNHIHQVAKCMAYQYRDEIGPWVQFLGVYR